MAIFYQNRIKVDSKELHKKSMEKHELLCKLGNQILKRGNIIEYITGSGHSLRTGKCGIVFIDPNTMAMTRPDVIGWNFDLSIGIEAKTNLRDFRNDKKKKEFIGKVFYYLSFKGIIPINEIPNDFGLIEYEQDKNIITVEKVARVRQNYDYYTERNILLSMYRKHIKKQESNQNESNGGIDGKI